MMCSSLGALAGILEAFKNDIIDPSAGQLAVVLTGIAGAVIGGTAMLGGVGTMIGMWFGMLVLGELQDGFNLRGISSYKYLMIEGAAILVFMIVNTYLSKLRGSGRLVSLVVAKYERTTGRRPSRRVPPVPRRIAPERTAADRTWSDRARRQRSEHPASRTIHPRRPPTTSCGWSTSPSATGP